MPSSTPIILVKAHIRGYTRADGVFVPAHEDKRPSAVPKDGSSGHDEDTGERSAATRVAFERRIDELFAGKPASRIGARVLDRSDLLGLLGHQKLPLVLREGKVIQGQSKHKNMTAEQWKKVPGWLESPAAVFWSDTVKGALVFVSPDLVADSVALVTVEPDSTVSATLVAHEVTNAYDKDGGPPPLSKWIRSDLLRYVNTKKFPAVAARAGLQLSGKAFANKPGTSRILNEKHLTGYRRMHRAQGDATTKALRVETRFLLLKIPPRLLS